MPEYIIEGIPVSFPFEPYDLQKDYMGKVIKCLSEGTNGVLESPTGTGKTLSLLCASLAWLINRKSELKEQIQKNSAVQPSFLKHLPDDVAAALINSGKVAKSINWGVPKIIYASRTHSQLTQAMQELKRTNYSFVRAVVLGSRDQLCIHPEVMREQGNANKVQLCKIRVDTRTCSFQMRVESKKDDPDFRGPTIMDIEDLIKVGQKLKMCPYYGAKELVDDADITFMPYNYLLDPKARKANKVELKDTIIILDEAHNIEKICEESASVQIRSSDVAMAIEDVTHIMKAVASQEDFGSGDEPKDFTIDDLAGLKEMLLNLEKAFDGIVVENKNEGATFPASYMLELLERANLRHGTVNVTLNLLDKLIQFVAVDSRNSMFRKGVSFQILSDLLTIVFVNKEEMSDKVHKSFKTHVQIEEVKNPRGNVNNDGWHSKTSSSSATTKAAKVINYWCFNPGFGMEQLLNKNVRSIILTSGTLAPLKPLIAELAIPVGEHLENPHIVTSSQVYVKIIGSGPDREQLISNYVNRDNPKYISSLGQTVLNVARIVPDGLLVFFPSYPMLNQCMNSWQVSGLWAQISRHKPIFTEPRNKESFTKTMEEFYQNIRDLKGACFLAVCRGKVSEGLDFADRNGRAVIITGLPFPPLKDPKVILKKRYLEDNRTKENELLTGQAWYSLDATRAVNQAIGRVIRHRHDYGAILLCDARFQQPSQISQLSKWIRKYLGDRPASSPFGPVVRELREFFRNAEKLLPAPKERTIESMMTESCDENEVVRSKYFSDPKERLAPKLINQKSLEMGMKIEKANSIESWTPESYKAAAGRMCTGPVPTALDFMSRLGSGTTVKSTIDFNSIDNKNTSNTVGLVSIHKRDRSSPPLTNNSKSILSTDVTKKKRYKLVDNSTVIDLTPSSSSQSLTNSLNGFGLPSKTQLQSQATMKQAPEQRVDFLKVLRSLLPPENFSAFTAALISYKRDDSFQALMSCLLDVLGKPHLLYMLVGMRRFIKNEHKTLFDEMIAKVT